MSGVEKRFCSNTELVLAVKAPAEVKLVRHKDFSHKALARLLDNGKEIFLILSISMARIKRLTQSPMQ
jgi:hypothetical protein